MSQRAYAFPWAWGACAGADSDISRVKCAQEEMLGDGYAAAERIALEPNGNPNYLSKPEERFLAVFAAVCNRA